MIKHTSLIPPINHLDQYASGPYHLLLAHLALQYPIYIDHFRRQAELGAFLTLDNGAWEGESLDIELLFDIGTQIGIHEIALPDKLFDSHGTVAIADRALHWLSTSKHLPALEKGLIKLMIIPQGKESSDWGECLLNLRSAVLLHLPFIKALTIGVPKSCDDRYFGGRLRVMNKYVTKIVNTEPILIHEYHMLGWGRDLWKLSNTSAYTPYTIRSTDSAKPFVYALNGIKLVAGGDVPDYPTRSDDYFDSYMSAKVRAAADHNIEIFRRASYGQIMPLPSDKTNYLGI